MSTNLSRCVISLFFYPILAARRTTLQADRSASDARLLDLLVLAVLAVLEVQEAEDLAMEVEAAALTEAHAQTMAMTAEVTAAVMEEEEEEEEEIVATVTAATMVETMIAAVATMIAAAQVGMVTDLTVAVDKGEGIKVFRETRSPRCSVFRSLGRDASRYLHWAYCCS